MTTDVPVGYPPTDSFPTEGTFYRLAVRGLTSGELAGPNCFLRPYQTLKGALVGQRDDPEAHGLSIRSSLEALERARDLNPRIARKPVAEFIISQRDGWVKHTPEEGEGHHDWWTAPPGYVPEAYIVAEAREVA